MARRQHLTLTVVLGLIVFFSITYFFSGGSASRQLNSGRAAEVPLGNIAKEASSTSSTPGPQTDFKIDLDEIPNLAEGESIAPKLENATLKAELGRATWKFLHTMVARFPEKPSDSDRKTIVSFFHLFGRLYPCGDCAKHFREILKKYPPQTSSRNAAAGWLCYAHNIVNERLKKPIFDCTKIGDFYDCGCGDEDKKGDKTADKKPEKRGEPDLNNSWQSKMRSEALLIPN